MTPELSRQLAIACAEHFEREEKRAHAEFYFDRSAVDRKCLAAEGARPWRGLMQPSAVHVINILEEADLYEAPVLTQITLAVS